MGKVDKGGQKLILVANRTHTKALPVIWARRKPPIAVGDFLVSWCSNQRQLIFEQRLSINRCTIIICGERHEYCAKHFKRKVKPFACAANPNNSTALCIPYLTWVESKRHDVLRDAFGVSPRSSHSPLLRRVWEDKRLGVLRHAFRVSLRSPQSNLPLQGIATPRWLSHT